eukprot:948247-Pyramimonas_sp.AAC.1
MGFPGLMLGIPGSMLGIPGLSGTPSPKVPPIVRGGFRRHDIKPLFSRSTTGKINFPPKLLRVRVEPYSPGCSPEPFSCSCDCSSSGCGVPYVADWSVVRIYLRVLRAIGPS